MQNETIKQISENLRTKKYSSYELTNYYLDRIEKLNPVYNAVITTCKEHALKAATDADNLLNNNSHSNLSPITGVPILQKDIFCTKNIKTTCASKMLDNFIAPYDATVIHKFNQAGSVMLGKTNMDEFAMGSSNENSYYGPVKNPWNTDYVPGGSSGGAAAAVAGKLAPAATGTDTGGSIRQPAAYCGITGLKPTYGRVSRYGMIAFASSLDQAGPMAQTAEDCAMLLQVMAGYDNKDSTSVNKPVPDYTANLNNNLNNKILGLPKEFFNKDLPKDMQILIENSVNELKSMGAKIKEISLPNIHYSIPVYYIIAPAECSSNLSRFDGIRFGYRCDNPKDLNDLYTRSRTEGFGEEVKRRILTGTYVLSSGFYDAYYVKAQKIRNLIANDFKQAFKNVDAIIAPTSPSTAFKLNEKSNDLVSMYLNDIYTSSVNLAGLPGISVPCGFINNMPAGLQIIGDYFKEDVILNIAHQYQLATKWDKQYAV